MPRYTFVTSDGITITDPGGQCLPDIETAKHEALNALIDIMMSSDRNKMKSGRTWTMNILDSDGATISTVTLALTVTIDKLCQTVFIEPDTVLAL